MATLIRKRVEKLQIRTSNTNTDSTILKMFIQKSNKRISLTNMPKNSIWEKWKTH